ncbi:MAG: flavodoxin family protein [Clostridia bacterium]|nr:flavodoxin family protein [Clostridia bacterium]
MKTIIFNGSPRPNGDTVQLIRYLTARLNGEVKTISAYRSNIAPCIDCRFCWEDSGCVIKDEMQEVYDYLTVCDNVVIASPIYFSEITGKLLDLGSRFQPYYCSRYFRKTDPGLSEKKGGIILVGGGDGSLTNAETTSQILLNQINCKTILPAVCYHNTNNSPAISDEGTLAALDNLAEFLNRA